MAEPGAPVDREADGELHGQHTTWNMMYEDLRTVRSTGRYDHGQEVGEWIYNYAEGNPRERGSFEAGLKIGLWTSWHLSGSVAEEAEFAADVLHGRVTEYDEQGQRLREGRYEHGEPVGPQLEFHPDGSIKSEKTYAGGRPNGIARTYWPGGQQKESEGELVDGRQEGPWTYWKADGSINEEWSGTYAGGQRVGGSAAGREQLAIRTQGGQRSRVRLARSRHDWRSVGSSWSASEGWSRNRGLCVNSARLLPSAEATFSRTKSSCLPASVRSLPSSWALMATMRRA